MIQHLGKICVPEVKVGDKVSCGQRIASLPSGMYSPIHASISGTVSAIQDCPHPVIGRAKAVVIQGDGKEDVDFSKSIRSLSSSFTAQELRDIVLEAGIVGMGGASFPTHIKLNPPKPVNTLIINGAECEPYLTADSRLMVEKTTEIVQGIRLIVSCLGIKDVYIGIEDNKPEAIKAFSAFDDIIKVKVLKSDYPQGGEKQLIRNILGKELPRGKYPFDIGALVQNVSTMFAIYEAVYKGKPLIERIVTVTGSCIKEPVNLLARIGTPIKDLIEFCGLNEEPAKIIIGGPMMGIAQYTDEVPLIKSSNGLLLMNKEEAEILEEKPCIRCAACVRGCPVGLMPCQINLASERSLWLLTKEYGASDCIECGICNYVCPANRRLLQTIKRAKLEGSR